MLLDDVFDLENRSDESCSFIYDLIDLFASFEPVPDDDDC